MTEFMIQLTSISEIKRFVHIAGMQNFDIVVISGRCTINAKSIMSVFGLDLSRPLRIEADCSEAECEEFVKAIGEFIIAEDAESK